MATMDASTACKETPMKPTRDPASPFSLARNASAAAAGKRLALTTLLMCALAPAACTSPPKADPERVNLSNDKEYELDQQLVREPFNEQTRLGVIRQRSLGEEHFLPGSSSLSPLGRRDLTILADALRDDGGSIAVRRGLADDALYDARLAEVRRRLEATGIARARIALNQAPAGGSGVATSAALLIRENINSTPLPQGQPQILNPRDVNGPSGGGMP
jgi:hypothetical protein